MENKLENLTEESQQLRTDLIRQAEEVVREATSQEKIIEYVKTLNRHERRKFTKLLGLPKLIEGTMIPYKKKKNDK
jgi:hypothetical protein